jgi:hypothetical protein
MANAKRKCGYKPCGQFFKPESGNVGTVVFCTEDHKNLPTKLDRQVIAAKKRALKESDLSAQKKLTQQAFNEMIRWLDDGMPCISCGRHGWEIDDKYVGGKWDCGHFKSVGAMPSLRFEPCNAYRQCKSCNAGSAKYAAKGNTVAQQYETRLSDRMGQHVVDWLKGPHEAKHYTCEQLMAMRSEYKAETRRLEKGLPPSRDWRALPEQQQVAA